MVAMHGHRQEKGPDGCFMFGAASFQKGKRSSLQIATIIGNDELGVIALERYGLYNVDMFVLQDCIMKGMNKTIAEILKNDSYISRFTNTRCVALHHILNSFKYCSEEVIEMLLLKFNISKCTDYSLHRKKSLYLILHGLYEHKYFDIFTTFRERVVNFVKNSCYYRDVDSCISNLERYNSYIIKHNNSNEYNEYLFDITIFNDCRTEWNQIINENRRMRTKSIGGIYYFTGHNDGFQHRFQYIYHDNYFHNIPNIQSTFLQSDILDIQLFFPLINSDIDSLNDEKHNRRLLKNSQKARQNKLKKQRKRYENKRVKWQNKSKYRHGWR